MLICGDRRYDNIDLVLFDKDGTLADSEAYLLEQTRRRLDALEVEVPGIRPWLARAFGLTEEGLDPSGLMAVGSRAENVAAAAAAIAAHTARPWAEAVQQVTDTFRIIDGQQGDKAAQTPLFAQADPLLRDLVAAGVQIGLVSADTRANLMAFCSRYDCAGRVSGLRGSDDRPAKPDPGCIRSLCAELGISPTRTLMVGDATSDMCMGRGAGCAGVIGVRWGWRRPPRITDADIMLEDWSQLRLVAQPVIANT